MSDKKRPTFIKAKNVHGLTMTNNKARGDMDFADLENVTDVKSDGNEHIVPETSSKKSWLAENLWLPLLVAVVAVAIGVFIFQPFQQTIQDNSKQHTSDKKPQSL